MFRVTIVDMQEPNVHSPTPDNALALKHSDHATDVRV
jgi:hypothetical protein